MDALRSPKIEKSLPILIGWRPNHNPDRTGSADQQGVHHAVRDRTCFWLISPLQ